MDDDGKVWKGLKRMQHACCRRGKNVLHRAMNRCNVDERRVYRWGEDGERLLGDSLPDR